MLQFKYLFLKYFQNKNSFLSKHFAGLKVMPIAYGFLVNKYFYFLYKQVKYFNPYKC